MDEESGIEFFVVDAVFCDAVLYGELSAHELKVTSRARDIAIKEAFFIDTSSFS